MVYFVENGILGIASGNPAPLEALQVEPLRCIPWQRAFELI